MSPQRPDGGDWNESPHPRKPASPRLVVLRHSAETELASLFSGLVGATWLSADSIWRLVVVVVVVVSGPWSSGVREMVVGQYWRVVMSRRLQESFSELGICSRRRRLTPSVIGSAAMPGATIVRVWLPVGLTVDHLVARRHEIAEVCFVDEILVEKRPGRLNTVEVIMVRRTLGRRV